MLVYIIHAAVQTRTALLMETTHVVQLIPHKTDLILVILHNNRVMETDVHLGFRTTHQTVTIHLIVDQEVPRVHHTMKVEQVITIRVEHQTIM